MSDIETEMVDDKTMARIKEEVDAYAQGRFDERAMNARILRNAAETAHVTTAELLMRLAKEIEES